MYTKSKGAKGEILEENFQHVEKTEKKFAKKLEKRTIFPIFSLFPANVVDFRKKARSAVFGTALCAV